MGNRACSSLCYSGDHTAAVNDDDHRKGGSAKTTTTMRRMTIARKTATTVWSKPSLGILPTLSPAEARDIVDDKNDDDDSVDTYYKRLTQHESTNRFSRTHNETPLDDSLTTRAYAGGLAAAATTISAPQRGQLPEIPANGNSFEYYHCSMSSDTHGREAREGSIGYGRRASMTGEREEIQDEST